MDNLTRRLGWMLMQLFTLKWSCLWFFDTIAKEHYLMESNPGTPGCGQAGGQSPSRLPGLFIGGSRQVTATTLEKQISWEDLAVALWAITGTGFGVGSRMRYLGPWSQRHSRNHGGYQWHASSCYSSYDSCIQTKVHRALRGCTATLGYLNLKNPDF